MIAALSNPSRPQLWTEFVLLFAGVPLVMAATFGSYSLFAVVWALAGVSAILLAITPGFRWSMLWQGPVLREWRLILAFSVGTALVSALFVAVLVPQRWLELPMNRTGLWLMILLAYPILSAWPQELIYRSLFFERYGALFPSGHSLILANGAAFGFGHLFYEHSVTIVMTALGGAFMGWAYLRGRSMLLAWVLHAIAGCLIFTSGLGIFFYHGGVG